MMEDRLVMSTVNGDPIVSAFAMIDLAKAKPKPKPAAPSFTATPISTTQVNLSWTKVSGASKYLVLVNGQSVQPKGLNKKATGDTISNLTPNTSYTFDVVYVKNGRKYPEASVTRSTLPLPQPTPPPAPNWTATAISSSVIEVKWSPEPGTTYVVSGLDYGAPGWQVINTFSSNYDADYIYGLDPGTTYWFNVTAQNSAGTTAGTPASATTPA